MNIVCMCGILYRGWLYTPLWDGVERHLRAACTRDKLRVFTVGEFYLPWQLETMRTLRDHTVAAHDTGEDVVLVGHSMGGVIVALPSISTIHHRLGNPRKPRLSGMLDCVALWRTFSLQLVSRVLEKPAYLKNSQNNALTNTFQLMK